MKALVIAALFCALVPLLFFFALYYVLAFSDRPVPMLAIHVAGGLIVGAWIYANHPREEDPGRDGPLVVAATAVFTIIFGLPVLAIFVVTAGCTMFLPWL